MGGTALPQMATTADPGSENKIQVLERRAAQRLCLHHPGDPRQPVLVDVGERIYRVAEEV